MSNIIAIGLGIGLNYVLPSNSRIVKFIIDIIAWSF